MNKHLNTGFSLIEVLVTIVILLIGLLGLAGLQGRALTAQMESYQRSQAITLLKDMANRMQASNSNSGNRANAANYVTGSTLGTGGTCPTTGVAIIDTDLCEWHTALLGASEVRAGTSNVGAMIGARGCIYQLAAPATGVASTYLIVVAWQGLNSTAAPDVSTATSVGQCGKGQYTNSDGTINEARHRVVSLPVSFADKL